MNGSKHISNCYSALQGLYWMSYGAIYTFAAVFTGRHSHCAGLCFFRYISALCGSGS